MTATASMVYLKDLVPSAPLPPLFQIEWDDFPSFLENLTEIASYKNNSGEVYVKFGKFFGEHSPLNRVRVRASIMGKITNHYLYCLEAWLTEEIKKDKFFPRTVFVEDVTFPIKDVSEWANKSIIK